MFKIEAVIHSYRLDPVREALEEIGIHGLTAIDCRGMGAHRGVTHSFRGSNYANTLSPHVMVIVAVSKERLDEALDAIQKAAATGEFGDGMIFVHELHEAVRIRTNERGTAALS
jgi:nitrogen regulatory protein PII